ncbi:hypothetical protein QTP88_009226 [Uroleucon formosanum]
MDLMAKMLEYILFSPIFQDPLLWTSFAVNLSCKSLDTLNLKNHYNSKLTNLSDSVLPIYHKLLQGGILKNKMIGIQNKSVLITLFQ